MRYFTPDAFTLVMAFVAGFGAGHDGPRGAALFVLAVWFWAQTMTLYRGWNLERWRP